MICQVCAGELTDDQHVQVNGLDCHAVKCFAVALRSFEFVPSELAIRLGESMSPTTAYKAGETYVATIVASRRRVKKRK